MKQYKKYMERYRSDKILLGLEIDLNADEELTVLEEDMQDLDIIIGAIHWVSKRYNKDKDVLPSFLSSC